MTQLQELRDQSKEQLLNQIDDVESELFQLENELAMQRKLERPHLMRAKKREKAQILTILTERGDDNDKPKE